MITVHPRDRGEHIDRETDFVTTPGSSPRIPVAGPPTGSSPRSRGTRYETLAPWAPDRFIPAIAGNTDVHGPSSMFTPVHPRDRGEHSSDRNRACPDAGSSPRSRGTLERGLRALGDYRFIPAIAGNTNKTGLTRWPPTVHPRDRGEHVWDLVFQRLQIGSSPRSRGTLLETIDNIPSSRFIPAIAGNTLSVSSSHSGIPVHPRDRGEHNTAIGPEANGIGSSPRSRGTRPLHLHPDRLPRFIPAIAGNTG